MLISEGVNLLTAGAKYEPVLKFGQCQKQHRVLDRMD
jgi:hypothetical protein